MGVGEYSRLEPLRAPGSTAWRRGSFDPSRGAARLLFGRMYEDAAVELAAFRPGGRVFCIASAGCTAIELAPRHEVVAVDINPVQLEYVRRRIAGAGRTRGLAERVMSLGRLVAPLAGWSRARVRAFFELHDPAEQMEYWRRHLDTLRFRAAFDGLLSRMALRTVYAPAFLDFLPQRFGPVLRGRLERCFARHANRANPHARALLLGELSGAPATSQAREIRLVCSDAAAYLEKEPAGSFDGFTLSNILDGADSAYGRRLFAAVRRAAASGAVAVIRSFREPRGDLPTNRAAEDRAMLWGIVDVRPAAAL